MENEFFYKDKHRFILTNNNVYRNFDIIEKCVVQVLRQSPPNNHLWYAMNIGNSVPCFKGTGLTKEEALNKMFENLKEFYQEQKDFSDKMIDLANRIILQ